MQLYEFYNQSIYQPEYFIDTSKAAITIDNINMYKPDGGLWASPIEEDKTIERWPDWLRTSGLLNGGSGNRLKHKMTFSLTEWTRLLVINSYEDLVNAAKSYPLTKEKLKEYLDETVYQMAVQLSSIEKEKGLIDWRKLAGDYDAVLVTDKAIRQSSACIYWQYTNLYAWDTASLVVFHKDVINIISQE